MRFSALAFSNNFLVSVCYLCVCIYIYIYMGLYVHFPNQVHPCKFLIFQRYMLFYARQVKSMPGNDMLLLVHLGILSNWYIFRTTEPLDFIHQR
jgi:hypothetical protein